MTTFLWQIYNTLLSHNIHIEYDNHVYSIYNDNKEPIAHILPWDEKTGYCVSLYIDDITAFNAVKVALFDEGYSYYGRKIADSHPDLTLSTKALYMLMHREYPEQHLTVYTVHRVEPKQSKKEEKKNEKKIKQ